MAPDTATASFPTRSRQPAIALKPVVDPADWSAKEMTESGEWIFEFSPEHVSELEAAVERTQAKRLGILDIGRADFPLPTLGPRLDELREQLLEGIGFVQMRGFPIRRLDRLTAATAYWGIGTYLGRALPQNAQGHMLGHVIDRGHTQANPDQRGYQTRETLDFHSDSCDIVGLLCLQPSKSGGVSKIVSTVAIYNEMLRRRPDLAEELCNPFAMDRRGEVPEGKKPYYELPVFSFRDGYLSTRWARVHIESAQRFEDVPRLTSRQSEALDLFDTLTEELHMGIRFEPGDIQFLHNHVISHSRTEYEEHEEPERKRHLLRLWLNSEGGRPLVPGFAERIATGIVVKGMKLQAPIDP